jgi:hypothetical protein
MLRTLLYNDKSYSGSTVNKILNTLKEILQYAEDESLMQRVPRIEKVSNIAKTTRGALTHIEVQKTIV